MSVHRFTLAFAGSLLIAGCATQTPAPVMQPARPPLVRPPAEQPGNPLPGSSPQPSQPLSPAVMPQTPTSPPPPGPGEAEVRAMIQRLIPPGTTDSAGWSGDLYNAFAHLGLPHAAPVYCAAIAVIEQESGFQANPVVPGLPAIVWRELERRAHRYGVPLLVIQTALRKRSPDGRSYKERIDHLRTERELDAIFHDLMREIPRGQQLFAGFDPVRTGGPMQVSVAFAEQQVHERAYPYPAPQGIRAEVFSRRGGVYFGSAILLDYPAPYTEVVYRFADFNAGRYSSRNAAFQAALGRVAGRPQTLDGDLLRYKDERPLPEPSAVELALRGIAGRLRLSPGEIRRDLLQEKEASFSQTPLYKRLFALADQQAGQALPRQAMPAIDLKSPKITRKLTTEWFARRVEGRFRQCLTRERGG